MASLLEAATVELSDKVAAASTICTAVARSSTAAAAAGRGKISLAKQLDGCLRCSWLNRQCSCQCVQIWLLLPHRRSAVVSCSDPSC